MDENICALAADTKVETPEGAMAIRALTGKAIAVFTREGERVRFRMTQNVRKTLEQQPVLNITLENNQSFRVGPSQVLYRKGMEECRAGALQVGDRLACGFSYPDGYHFVDDAKGGQRESTAALQVTKIEPGGTADVYAFAVNQTGCFMLTAGVFGKAESA